MTNIKSLRKILLPTILLFLIIPTFSSLLRPGYFPMHDDMQAMRLLQMDKCVMDLQIPCRWVPDMGYGYGYPQFNYYPPLPYYIMEGSHLLGLSFLDSVKVGFILSVVVSGLGMYIFARSLWGNLGGFLSAIFYVYAPYRAVDMYVRGAVGEFWAMSFLPFIFWSARGVLLGSKKSILWLALSLAGLLTSHNISTLITLPLIFAWVIFILWQENLFKNYQLLRVRTKNFLLSLVWGFSMAAFFVIPAFFEKKYAHIETLLAGYFNYLAHFVSVKQLFLGTYWGYGQSELGPYDDILLSVGVLHWTFATLAILLLAYLRKRREFLISTFFLAVGLMGMFMTHSRSTFIWEKISILSFIQFPWRFLIISTFAFSIISGAFFTLIKKEKKLAYLSVIGILSFVLIFYAGYFRPKEWINIFDNEKFSGELWEKQLTISIFDYLPIYAKYPPAKKAPDEPFFAEGEGEIIEGEKKTRTQRWKVRVDSDLGVLTFPLFDFPGWRVYLDSSEVEKKRIGELGLVGLEVPRGEHEVSAKLSDTPVRKFSNFVSLVGTGAVFLFLRKRG